MVVNATGPSFGIEDSADALLNSLRTSGLVSGDALHLGIRSARYGACRNAQGIASETCTIWDPCCAPIIGRRPRHSSCATRRAARLSSCRALKQLGLRRGARCPPAAVASLRASCTSRCRSAAVRRALEPKDLHCARCVEVTVPNADALLAERGCGFARGGSRQRDRYGRRAGAAGEIRSEGAAPPDAAHRSW